MAAVLLSSRPGQGRALGQHEPGVLLVVQRLAEDLALLRVRQRQLHRLLRLDHGIDGQDQPLLWHLVHQRREARAFGADAVRHRHPASLEEQLRRVGGVLADLAQRSTAVKARGLIGLDRDQRDRPRVGGGLQGILQLDRDDDQVRGLAVGDEGLGGVDDVLVTVSARAPGHRPHVAPGARLGHGDRADHGALDHRRQPARALFLAAVLEDVVGDHPAVDVVAPALLQDAGLLLGNGHLMQDVAAGAAVLLGHSRAEQADPARLHPEFPVDVPLLGPLGHLRRGLALEELPRHVAQRLQFVGHPLRDVVSRHAVASAPFPFPASGSMHPDLCIRIYDNYSSSYHTLVDDGLEAEDVMTSDGVLGGIKVVDLSEQVPGPYATRLLAGLGADVIKVERPDAGDRLRQRPVMFAAENRGKRDLSIDLKSADGRDALLRVIAAADVLVETYRPGVMDRLGLGFDALLEVNPQIIYLSISGYGATGPYRDLPGHDFQYLSFAGAIPPPKSYFAADYVPTTLPVADMGASLYAVLAVVLALHEKLARPASF